jgi:hypothetical protein
MKAKSPSNKDILQWTLPRVVGATYGLLSRKAADPRWPEIFITALVLKKYRGKSSLIFMVKSGYAGMRKHQTVNGETKIILGKLADSKPRHLFQLAGIYSALSGERGPAVATAAFIEILKIINEKRKRSRSWLRIRQAAAAPQVKRGARVNSRKRSHQ